MNAYHKELLAPSGASHALSVRLTALGDSADATAISHLITARDSLIQIWLVNEHHNQDGSITAKLSHFHSRRLHGTITALARVRTLASKVDGADRVLVSFKHAKMALMEWTPAAHDLLPVSLHTFEKIPQVVEGRTLSATDPNSKLSVLLLPTNTGGDGTLAILPFFQEEIDFESLGVDAQAWDAEGVASIPYAPSHLLPLSSLSTTSASTQAQRSTTLYAAPSSSTPPPVRNVIDMVFLPGFTEPTLALLYAPEPTWTGRLEAVSQNHLVSIITLVPSSSSSSSGSASAERETTAVVIATSPPLPWSCLAIHPCPPDLGGTLVLTANGVLHLEQGGKLVGTAANGWYAKEVPSTGPGGEDGETVREGLEGAKVVFVANYLAMLFTRTGAVLSLTLSVSGRSVSALKLTRVGEGVGAACVERIRGSRGAFGERGYVFVGSEVGEGTLVGWQVGGENVKPTRIEEESHEMDLDDDDDDLYGTASSTTKPSLATPQPLIPAAPKRPLTLTNCDTLATYGGIRSISIGLVDDDSPPELVAATGSGKTAGLTIFYRSLSPRKRRKLFHSSPHSMDEEASHHDIATRGIWSLGLNRSSVGTPASVSDGEVEGNDNLFIASTSSSTKISFQVAGMNLGDVEVSEVTLGAASVLDGTAVVRVSEGAVSFIEANSISDLETQQVSIHLSALDGPAVRATVVQPWVLAVDAKMNAQLFEVDANTRSLVERNLPVVEDCASLSVFRDLDSVIPLVRPSPSSSSSTSGGSTAKTGAQREDEDGEDELYATSARRPVASDVKKVNERIVPLSKEGETRDWVVSVDLKGSLKIHLLPGLEEVFSASAIALFPQVIADGEGGQVPEEVDEDDVEIDRVAMVLVGQEKLRPHLVILLKNGSLAIYEAYPSISACTSSRPHSLGVRFVKITTRRLPVPLVRRPRPGDTPTLEAPRRELVLFEKLQGYTGVFFTGEEPLWLIAPDHGHARVVDHSERGVYAFGKAAFRAEDVDFVLQSRTEVAVASLPPQICFDREMPYIRAPRDRKYAHITFDIDSGLYVGGALFETEFCNFDDEGNPTFVNDSPELLTPTNFRSALELIIPGSWVAIDGYEFRANEFVSTVKSVSLATKSTASGRKDFVAVGTTVYRAEDLAARGGLYLFEVIKIVADPSTPHMDHKLKLLTFEDCKSVVGNLCDLDGYICLSMGQKLYVRAFEQDEVLIAVGFLDVGVHVTSLQAMKNFLLIGDALQSVTLVAFQEDPYKLVLLGRDYRPSRTTSANFLVNDGKVAFVVADLMGVLRLLEYDPTNIASQAGQKLLCRTEYNAGVEGTATLLFAKRGANEDIKQNGILYGGSDGSLFILVPVREAVFKRLQLLATQLNRHVQHFGGLNPRGYRIVKNDSVSRAITKGILDGELLAEFEWLPLDRQLQLAAAMGPNVDVDTLQINLRNLSSF